MKKTLSDVRAADATLGDDSRGQAPFSVCRL